MLEEEKAETEEKVNQESIENIVLQVLLFTILVHWRRDKG